MLLHVLDVRHIGVADHLPIDDRCRVLTVMEVLHILVYVVFLAYFGSQGDPHLVSPVVAHPAVGILVCCKHLVHRSIFLTTKQDIQERGQTQKSNKYITIVSISNSY